ncbi:MAG TPA: hypothetical protein VH325_03430 [Bryobacteraceae bacterium]|nr:hypothetical protein [Bryobacteraceae bacterium]
MNPGFGNLFPVLVVRTRFELIARQTELRASLYSPAGIIISILDAHGLDDVLNPRTHSV